MHNNNQSEGGGLRIIKAELGEICVYEVTDDELSALENGSPGSLQLNFAVFLLPIAISFLISILTTKIESVYLYACFVAVTIVGFVLGIFFFFVWLRSYRGLSSVSKRIRSRRLNRPSMSPSPSVSPSASESPSPSQDENSTN